MGRKIITLSQIDEAEKDKIYKLTYKSIQTDLMEVESRILHAKARQNRAQRTNGKHLLGDN